MLFLILHIISTKLCHVESLYGAATKLYYNRDALCHVERQSRRSVQSIPLLILKLKIDKFFIIRICPQRYYSSNTQRHFQPTIAT